MKYKKIMIMLIMAIFLFAMATASAADSNDTAVAVEDRQLTDEIIQASENQENTIQASENQENTIQASAADLNDTAVAVEDGQLTDEIIQASENQENTIQASVSATNVTVDTPTTITVTIPDNATGYVIITGNFTDNEIYVENSRFSSGVATVDVSGLAEGTYSVHIKYCGLDADPYSTVENDTTFKVSKVAATGIKVDAHDTDYGKAALIEVTVPNADMTGTICLKLNDAVGTHITLSIYENKVTWNVTGLAAGKYTVYANYTGNYKYNVNDTLSKTFEVNKVEPSLTIDDAFTDALTSAEIIVHINKTATGSITIIVDGKPYTQPIKDGVANFTIDVLPAGDYDISAFYNPGGDKNYTGGFNTNIKGLHVTKVADYNIVLDVENITYGDVETVTVYINETGTVTLKLNGETYDAKDISGGKVVFPIEGLSAGNYTVEAIYIDPSGNVTSAKATFTVNKVNSTLTVNDIVFDYGSSGSTVVSLAGADGVNATVVGQPKAVVKVNGTNITVSDLDAGTYTLTVTTIADKNHNNITKNATITVNKVNATLTVNDVVLDYGESKNITVTAEGATGITAKINDADVVVVDNFTIPISGLAAGNYTLTVTTIPDGDHNPVSKTVNITVNKASTEIILENETMNLEVNDIVSTGATLTPPVGNLNYTSSDESVVIVENGIIRAVGAGTAIITVSFEGNDDYAAAENKTIDVTVKLKDASVAAYDMELIVGSNETIYYFTDPDGLNVTFVQDDSGVYTVDSNGVVSALKEGTGNILVKVGGDGVYAENSTVITVSVSKIPTEITIANATLDVKALNFTFAGATLNPAEAGNLSYNSSNSSVAMVFSGIIFSVGQGNAVITVSYDGNDKYAAAENKTISITVSLNDVNVSVNNSTLDLKVGDTFAINATTVPAIAKMFNVTYNSSDESVVTVDKNGTVTATGEGNAIITVGVGDGRVFAKNSTEILVTVSKIPTEISVAAGSLDLKVLENFTAGATLTPADAGNLTYTSSNKTVVIVEDGMIMALGEGTATVTVSFAGDYKYAAAENKTIDVAVSLNPASVSVNNSTLELYVDDNFTIVATTVPAGLNVTYVPDNSGVVSVDENGVVTALMEGTGSILVKVGGDGVYAENSTNVTVTVSKIPTEITIDSASLDLFVGDETVIVANLTPAGAGNVTFTSSNDTVVEFDDEGNVIAQGKGQAIITVSFAGDNKYAAAESKNITVTVSLNDASVTVDNATLDLKVGETYAINATKRPDTIMLDITYTSSNSSVVTVDEKGIVTAVGEGSAIITVEVGDDEIYARNSTNVTVTVSKVPTEIDANSITATYNVNKDLVITLKDANGNALSGVNVAVNLNGAKTYTTDSNGQVKVSTKGLAPKAYTAKITFNGNTIYAKSTKDVKVTVKKATPKLTVKKKIYKTTTKTKKYTIVLKDNVGKAIKKAKVTLKVKGKTYKAKTNSKGKATFKIKNLKKKGTFKAVIKYKGNKYYKKLTKKAKIKVIVTFKTVSRGSKDKATVKEIQQALKDHGYYLTYKGKYLKIDGIYHGCTERSIKEFQKDKGLKVTGKVDEKTAKKLGIL